MAKQKAKGKIASREDLQREFKQQEVWDSMAESWKKFRDQPFPKIVLNLVKKWKPGKILDIGCGNSKNLMPFAKKEFECYGIDFSNKMISLAKTLLGESDIKLRVANAKKLPFKSKSFDYCLNIALLHHIPTEKERILTLTEMRRVMKKDGKALITVWNKFQFPFLRKKKQLYIPWSFKDRIYYRYYYFFDYKELADMLRKVGFRITFSRNFGRNLVFVIEK